MQTEDNWKNISYSDDVLTNLLDHPFFISNQSKHPLIVLKRNLFLHLILGVLIILVYIAVIVFFQYWQVQLAMSIVLAFTAWAIYTSYLQYKKLPSSVSAMQNMLSEMKFHYNAIQQWCSLQQKVALFIYPISITGGFILGGVSGSGKSVEEFMSKPAVWIALGVCMVLLIPACYALAKWMTRYSFGKHIKTLKSNIEELENNF